MGSGTKTSGVVKIIKDLDLNLEGYDLLLVEDILDSGKTLYYLREILKERNPASTVLLPCSTSLQEEKLTLHRIIPALKYRMSLW